MLNTKNVQTLFFLISGIYISQSLKTFLVVVYSNRHINSVIQGRGSGGGERIVSTSLLPGAEASTDREWTRHSEAGFDVFEIPAVLHQAHSLLVT